MVYADRLMRLLAEEALCRLPSIAEDGEVQTPVGTAREHREEITTKRDRHRAQVQRHRTSCQASGWKCEHLPTNFMPRQIDCSILHNIRKLHLLVILKETRQDLV